MIICGLYRIICGENRLILCLKVLLNGDLVV